MNKLLFLVLCLFALTQITYAHDPFDASLRVLVRESDLEATIILGIDAAKRVLVNSGLSTDQVADLSRHRGPHDEIEIPLGIATKCLEVSREGKRLKPTHAKLLSEGLEVTFTFLYTRPPTGPLQIRAVCYDEIKEMRDGSFVATNEAADPLGAALLSRTSTTATMILSKSEPGATH